MTMMSISSPGASAFMIDKMDTNRMIKNKYNTGQRRRHISTSTSTSSSSSSMLSSPAIISTIILDMAKGKGDGNAEEDERGNQKGIAEDNIDTNSTSDGKELNGQGQNELDHENTINGKSSTNTESELESKSMLELKSQLEKQQQENQDLNDRVVQLEALAGSQAVEIRKLREECEGLKEAAVAFTEVVELLRQAGLSVDQQKPKLSSTQDLKIKKQMMGIEKSPNENLSSDDDNDDNDNNDSNNDSGKKKKRAKEKIEYIDEAEIFGSAPASVTDAADAAGASILAALLGGKQRMLVDVRDAELTRDPDVLVQFIELAILPVAAGLEGLKTQKNRVKIVFPTVSQLMQYRKTMTLSAPEVVSLSTLGFDPVERRDNLVVIIAPSPDDEEGLQQMNELLESEKLRQPVVVLNHDMLPVAGPGGKFEPIYHLRLLTVQYMAGDSLEKGLQKINEDLSTDMNIADDEQQPPITLETNSTDGEEIMTNSSDTGTVSNLSPEIEDAALAAAMEHAHELGIHQGVTRAMVIRAYPRPWHVFVDTSPDTDADFEVAATFDEYPSQDDINYAIVECLEGSEREDELVAQQMQEAIESGQLNSISDMLGLPKKDGSNGDQEGGEDDDDDFYNDWDPWFGADTV
jgi:hypothetical protein